MASDFLKKKSAAAEGLARDSHCIFSPLLIHSAPNKRFAR